ncbi:MAG TPA: SIMPL domain-containing protein [Rhodocyclaceae bacterium]|jgi:predicted secreted protein|nr:SIMPL domain-containing protein [Rhodocyclaceae bacterium]
MSRSLLFCLCLIAAPVYAQTVNGTVIDFSVDASRSAPNDQFRATAFAEVSDAKPAVAAAQVNRQIAAALVIAKEYPSIKARTGSTQTWPVYGKNGTNIDTWRMRSELQLESRDAGAMSELLGKLQANLGVSQIVATPAPETAKQAEAEAMSAAIQAFRDRAALIASALGKKYRIREMNIGGGNRTPVYAMRPKALMSAEAAPMPIEGGDSDIVINISGKIELTDN